MTMAPHQWRGVIEEYRDRLPVGRRDARSSRCARAAPRCVPAPALSERTGCEVYLKVEGANPTGSFKDRGMTMAISKAVEEGAKAVICASTGNTSASAAAYAARAGLTCAVLVPHGQDRARQAGPGARARRAAAAGRRQLRRLPARSPASSPTDYPVALVNSVNPFRIEGQKTAAFEIVDALGDAPDIHCLPVGNAGNITAYWKGYREYAARRRRHAHPADVGLPGRRRGADRARRAGRATRDDRHRDPDRQPGLLDGGARRPRRVRRPHRRGHRPRRSSRAYRLLAAQRGRLRRAGVGRRRWPGCCRSPRAGRARPRAARRLHGHRQRAQGPRVGHRRRADPVVRRRDAVAGRRSGRGRGAARPASRA